MKRKTKAGQNGGFSKPAPMTDVVCPDCGNRFPIVAMVERDGQTCKCPACKHFLTIVVQGEGDRTLFSLATRQKPKLTRRERDEAGLK